MFSRAKVFCALAATALVLGAAIPASATIDPVTNLLSGGNDILVDTSGDIIVPGTGYATSADALAGLGNFTSGGTWIGKGSILVSTFAIDTITTPVATTTIGSGTAYNQLTGLVAIVATSVSINASGSWSTTFGSVVGSSAGTAAIAAMSAAAGAQVATWAPGTLLAMYDGGSTPYSKTGGTSASVLNTDIGTAVGGTDIWQLGLGSAGTGWNSVAVTNNIGIVGSIPTPLNGGQVNFSLDLTAAAPGYAQYLTPPGIQSTVGLPGQLVNLAGSANLLGTAGQATPFNAYDNADLSIDFTPVPEPASVCVWLGAFLIGGFSIRRRLSRS